ncbi:hypothetical protein [Bradyrhizobium sp. Cp5.3]|uniref:hypothetical protein n=1 Tax=Bradyrhizobium sp. Cp5.3 TaxID=443598 RepID=UPI0012ECA42E|nr:hypothetical protein [Bradyrhizobium sp. Cp5.3]
MTAPIRSRLRTVLSRNLLIDLEDRIKAEALRAHEVVRDGFEGLTPLRARGLEGQARFRSCEQGFEDVCSLHGGHLLEGGVMPKTDLRIHQPFMRFEHEGQGIILALASMPATGALPAKNKSRLAGVSVNYELSLRLDFDGTGPKIGDIFVALLVARDRDRAGKIEEIAVGVIESNYEGFLYYEPLNSFLAGEDGVAPDVPPPTPIAPPEAEQPQVMLKKVMRPFVPPEAPTVNKEEGDAQG